MVLIRVEYDAYNRRFKLLDRERAQLLEDGEQYLVVADLAVADMGPTKLSTANSKSLTRPLSQLLPRNSCAGGCESVIAH